MRLEKYSFLSTSSEVLSAKSSKQGICSDPPLLNWEYKLLQSEKEDSSRYFSSTHFHSFFAAWSPQTER